MSSISTLPVTKSYAEHLKTYLINLGEFITAPYPVINCSSPSTSNDTVLKEILTAIDQRENLERFQLREPLDNLVETYENDRETGTELINHLQVSAGRDDEWAITRILTIQSTTDGEAERYQVFLTDTDESSPRKSQYLDEVLDTIRNKESIRDFDLREGILKELLEEYHKEIALANPTAAG